MVYPLQRRQHSAMSDQGNHPTSVDDDSSEPTPIPTAVRPPPPQPQEQQQQQEEQQQRQQHRQYHPSSTESASALLLESTLMSFSVDGGDDTLPSLAMEQDPPSPLSRPSDSMMASSEQEGTGASILATNAGLGRPGQPSPYQPQHQPKTPYSGGASRNRSIPPIHEVLLDDNNSGSSNSNYGTREADDEDDTFFECVEDRSLAQRARRSLRHGGGAAGAGTAASPSESSSRGRVLLSSPDGQPSMPAHSRTGKKGGRRPSSGDHGGKADGRSGRGEAPTSASASSSTTASFPLADVHGQNTNNNGGGGGISGDDVVRVHESALHALQQLKEELVKSNQRNRDLVGQHDAWQQERTGLLRSAQDLRDQSQRQEAELSHLTQAHGRLLRQQEEWSAQRQQLLEQQRDLEAQLRDGARDKKEHMHRKLAADNRQRELRGQLDKLRDELEEATAGRGELAAELVQVQTERMDLEAEAAQLKAELADLAQQRQQHMDRVQQLEKQVQAEQQKGHDAQTSSEREIERLNASLRKANAAMHRLRAELTPKVRSAVRHMSGSGPAGSRTNGGAGDSAAAAAAASSDAQPPTLDSAIADRLARLRDSAERAHLIRGHKREIARLKAERDAAVHRLEHEHADAVKRAAKQAETKRLSHLEDLAKKMQEQHESHVEELEDAHRKRVSDLQRDYSRLREDSDEALQEALSRLAGVTQQCERETARRLGAEKSVEKLHRQVEAERKESLARHAEEIEKRRHDWEAERETMLVVLQKDCNTAFDHRRRNWGMGNTPTNTPHTAAPSSRHHQPPRPSPLSMNSVFFPEIKSTVESGAGLPTSATSAGRATFVAPSPSRLSSPSDGAGGPLSMISQSYSDMDSVLRETEELVQSML